MATNYPTSIDSFTNPTNTDTLATAGGSTAIPHATQHANLNDAMVAVQTKLGTGSSIPLTSGGTGKTTAPAAMANLMGYTSTATAAGTTTLTNTSSYYQQFTGTTTQTILLPVTNTLQTGWTFHIVNNSTGNLTVNSSGGNLVITVIPGTTAMVTCIGTALTTAADWESGLTDFSTYTGSGNVVLSAAPTLTGDTTVGTVNKVTITAPATSATLTLVNGSTLATNTAASLTFGLSSAATTVATIPSGTVTLMDLGTAQSVTGQKTFTQPIIANSSGTAASGLVDYNGDIFTATTSGTATGKGLLPATYWAFSNANSGAITTTTPVAIFPTGARTITLEAAKTYYFKLSLNFTATFTSGTTETVQLVPTFTQAPVAINYLSVYTPSTAGNSLAVRGTATTATTVTPAITATVSNGILNIEGYFQSNATTGGTLTFNAQMSTTGTSTVFNAGCYQQIVKLGTGVPAAISGTWA